MNRKRGDGFLTGNVFSIIVAVICISILVIGGWRLLSAGKDLESEDARNTLDSIIGKIELINEGNEGKITIRGIESGEDGILYSKDWYLVGWSEDEGEGEGKPDSCFGSSCLCVCKKSGLTKKELVRKDFSCQDEKINYCRNLDYKTIQTKTLIGDKVIPIQELKKVIFTQGDCADFISFNKPLNELAIQRYGDDLLLYNLIEGSCEFKEIDLSKEVPVSGTAT
jgi:hypothetical protein